MDALVQYTGQQLSRRFGDYISNAMRTRSGLQYRQQRVQPSWTGPALGRRTMAQRRAFARSRTLQRNRRRTIGGRGITTQHDERRIYQKHSMPRPMRRRWKRFKNKVLAVSEKDLGTRTVLFNATYAIGNTTDNQHHTIASFALYPLGSTNLQLDDLNTIVQLENAGNPTAAAGTTVDKTSKFIFKSGILDLTFRNTSSNNNNPDSSAKLEVDIYECIARKPFMDNFNTYLDFQGALIRGSLDTLRIGGAGNTIDTTTRGGTPWEFPNALSYFGIKILKKTKYMMPNQDTFTYQVRDPRRHVASDNYLARFTAQPNMPGWTRWVYVIAKLVPGLAIGPAGTAGVYQEALSVGVTRKYFYKIEGVSEDRDRYINQ